MGDRIEGVESRSDGRKDIGTRGLRVGWVGAWTGVLALALWLSQLAPIWLLVSLVGSATWTASAIARRDWFGLTAAAALWVAVGVGAGVQHRLAEIAGNWPELQLRVEESAAEALGEALDGLLVEGERAVAGAAEAALSLPASGADRETFRRLEVLQRTTGVSAIALYADDGSAIAWAGDHRGEVPLAARLGTQSYLFHEDPLFSYLYFVRPLPDGSSATAAFLLEARVQIGDDIVPFADRFERRYGTLPRFWLPERASAGAVWDWATDRPILSVSFAELTQQRWWERVVEAGRRGAGGAGLLALLLLGISWYRARIEASAVPVLVGTVALLIAPVGRIARADLLFSPLQFVLPGPFDLTLGALLLLLLGSSLWILTRSTPRRSIPVQVAIPVLVLLFPLAIGLIGRSAADSMLATRAGGGFAVQLATTLLIATPLFLVLRATRIPEVRWRRPWLMKALGYALPAAFGLAILLWWRPGIPVPVVAAGVWALPAALLLIDLDGKEGARRPLRPWLIAGWLAGSAALAFLWPMHIRAELSRAEREIGMLGAAADPFLDFLLRQFADQTEQLATQGASGVNLLYNGWVASGLAGEGYEARLTLWEDGAIQTELNLSELPEFPSAIVDEILSPLEEPVVRYFGGDEGLHYLLIAPVDAERRVTVAVPPRRRLAWTTPMVRFLHPEEDDDAVFRGETLNIVPVGEGLLPHAGDQASEESGSVHWVRTPQGWRSETLVQMPEGPAHAHMLVSTPGLPLLLTRAILVQTALLVVFLVLWLGARTICRDPPVAPFLGGQWLRSFRGRLSLALFVFFLLPTVVFGAVSYGAVAREVVRSAAALAQQALDQAATALSNTPLANLGAASSADLLMFHRGTLVDATAPELIELGLFHTWLPPEVYLRFGEGEGLQELEERRVAEGEFLMAYRRIDAQDVLAVPIPLASHEITRRQHEFRDVALLMALLGLGLSMVLALLVSRALARPLDELSRAAVMVGSGNLRTPLPEDRPDEFGSVYTSFNGMVRRLRRTRTALVQETRRTETIVAEAATGVLALDDRGRVELINPRATQILGFQLSTGEPLLGGDARREPFSTVIEELWHSPSTEADAELEQDGRIVRLRLRRLRAEDGAGGAVVALEDITAEVRTARVLAWGEMARQVAHEIKNPLTPIKLSVQHMRRAFLDGRPDFEQVLERNVEVILREIDRLSEIARAFSRFGTPTTDTTPLEVVDVGGAIEEVLTLYHGATRGPTFRATLPDVPLPPAIARAGELKEVLLNLLENAREAVDGKGEIVISAHEEEGAGMLIVSVTDNGAGIPAEELPWIFEPHFSTRSSGTGLGLAIVRRIVTSWGGEIRAESEVGAGTRIDLLLRLAESER